MIYEEFKNLLIECLKEDELKLEQLRLVLSTLSPERKQKLLNKAYLVRQNFKNSCISNLTLNDIYDYLMADRIIRILRINSKT